MVLELGAYRAIASLGRGGMADVFLAVRGGLVGFTKLVVIKRLREDLARAEDGARYRRLLLDEARLAARMRHRNVVQSFEVVDDAEQPFLAMEYLEGQPLSRVLTQLRKRRERMPVAAALQIASDVLSALDYAHRLADYDGSPLAVVHRDVSPQNVFCTYEGEVKLMDFGVAKFARAVDETEAGVLKGKVGYMAPEHARGETVDGRADVFAVGVVLWEMLAGRRLVRARSQVAALVRMCDEALPAIESVVPDVDPALARICRRALERDRDRRYPSAAAMRADVEAARAPHPAVDLAGLVQALFASERDAMSEQIRDVLGGTPHQSLVSLGNPAAWSGHDNLETVMVPQRAPLDTVPIARGSGRFAVGVLAVAIVLVVVAISVVLATRIAAKPTVPLATLATPTVVAEAELEEVLRICGSNTIGLDLAPSIVEAFLARRGATQIARHPTTDGHRVTGTLGAQPIAVSIAAAGTATAFDGLLAGTCDIGMASRPISDAEVSKLRLAGHGDLRSPATEHVIALDGIAVIVHPNNPVHDIDRDALRRIFSGEITTWDSGAPIRILARDNKSGTFDTFKHLVLGTSKLADAAQRLESSEQLADRVAADPAAIGFIGLPYVRSARAVAVGDPGAAPMLPTAFTITTESYLLSRRLFFYTTPRPSRPLVPDLVSFALSSAGQRVVQDAHFVDLEVVTGEHATCPGGCPARYVTLTRDARRLSVDFRFRRGSEDADSRAMRDLDRIVHFLERHRAAEVILLGFSDASGDRQGNVRLSRHRAETIAHELAQRGIRASAVEGFGPAMPIAANASEADREKNRRVEIWVRE